MEGPGWAGPGQPTGLSPFHTLLLYCPFAGWPSRGMEATARGIDGPYPEPLAQRGSVALLEPKLYCGRYSR